MTEAAVGHASGEWAGGRYRVWLTLGVLLLAGVAVAWSQAGRLMEMAHARSESAPGPEPAPVPPRVGALGRIEPGSEVLCIGGPVGDRVERLLVTEGQKVDGNAELAVLESHDVALAERQEIAALLEEAKARTVTTRVHGQATVRTAELKLQTIEKLDPLRIDSQKARLRSIEFEARNAEDEFVRAERLLAVNAMPREDHNRRKLEHQRQQELLKGEQFALAELEANYTLSKDTAQAELSQAKAAMEQALSAISVRSLERKLDLADVRVRQSLIRAPTAGQVLKIHTHAGERIGNDPILKLGNVAEMHAVAEVYETDVSRVRVGQSAVVSSPSLERPIEGTVVQVGLMIHKNDVLNVDPAADADSRVVEVRVKLDEPERAAGLTYLQVDVLINVGEGGGK